MPDTQPSFIIIGATKSATTWLLYNLRAHPDIYMPTYETHYFSRCYDRGPEWYAQHFEHAHPGSVIGEKSASYMSDQHAPARICQTIPGVRLIAQLRDPIERAYSDYCMHFYRGDVDRQIGRYLDPERTPIPRLVEDGRYHHHLQNVLRAVPKAQLQLILYDEIKTKPAAVFSEVCAHIGVAQPTMPLPVADRVKDRGTPRVSPTLRRWLQPIKGLLQPWRQTSGFRAARALVARQIDYPPLPTEVRERLRDYYRADVEQLSGLLGRDLGGWLEPALPTQDGARPFEVMASTLSG